MIRLMLTFLAAVAVALALVAVYAGMIWQALTAAGQEAFRSVATEAADTLLALAILISVAVALVLAALHRAYQRPARRLTQSARLIATANPAHRVVPAGAPELREAAIAVNMLATVYDDGRHAADVAIDAARADLAHERNRLAAVVAELAHAVIMCAADGTILLYNTAARALFAEAGPDTAMLGLGRSVYGIVDRALLDHTLERLHARLRQETDDAGAHFALTTRQGLTRAHLAPIMDAGGAFEGYLLTFAGTPGDLAAEASRQAGVLQLVEKGRAAVANMRVAADALEACDSEDRDRFLRAIRDEADAYTRHLVDAARHFEQAGPLRWPLDDIACTDLLHAARDHLRAAGGGEATVENGTGEAGVRADSYAVLHLLAYLARLLGGRYAVPALYLRTSMTPHYVCLDLGTRDLDASAPPPADWDAVPILDRGELAGLGARQIVERQGGAVWHKTNLHEHERYFRLLLVGAGAAAPGMPRTTATGSRPEFYDFELFYRTARTVDEHARLDELAYTVFDTETTGLEPSNGDEIISIGAVRIVNGRVLTRETFEQLVDPQRPLSAAAARITGIDAAMLAGRPTVGEVLPRFHRFCEGTVLVAHNSAFDLRFLQLKETATGVRFSQPVLDTLMLSAVLHPEAESHQLEAIAERHGVTVAGRHTALGDAALTAAVFLRMLPQLAQRGILTLGDAQRASLKTYYARVHY